MPSDFLTLALKLAILTFYLGVLIYALPVPLARLKRLAPESIVDSIYATLLALTIFAFYDLSGKLVYYMGGSWSLFDSWLLNALTLSALVKVLESLLALFPLFPKIAPVVNAILSPLSRMATLTIMLCVVLATIATIIRSYGYILIGIGLVLYSLPLRLGRDAGAWLIAFTIVFNIGLPMLPVFIAQFEPEKYPQLSPDSFTMVRIAVESAYQNPASHGVLVVRDERGEVVAVYELTAGGVATSRYSPQSEIVVLPSGRILYAYLQYSGVEFGLSPWPLRINSSTRELRLISPHLILIARPGVIVFSSTTNHSLEPRSGGWVVRVSAGKGDYLDIRYHAGCSIDLKYYGDVEVKRGVWTWRGVSGEAIRLIARNPGEIRVELSLRQCEDPVLASIESRDYLDTLASQLVFVDWNLFKAFVLYYLTVPTLYVTTLFLSTIAVARLIGGRGRLELRVV